MKRQLLTLLAFIVTLSLLLPLIAAPVAATVQPDAAVGSTPPDFSIPQPPAPGSVPDSARASSVFGEEPWFIEENQPSPILPLVVEIVSARFYPTSLTIGEILQVEAVIRNSNPFTIPTQGPPPGYRYQEGETVGEADITGAWRIGVDYVGRTQAADHPYRWGFGHDLAPGEIVTVSGSITLMTIHLSSACLEELLTLLRQSNQPTISQ